MKFRGIIDEECYGNKIDEVFVYGSLINEVESETFYIEDKIGTRWHIDEKTIGQFISNKDKNGKEIYEGDYVDICRHNDENTIYRILIKDIRFLDDKLFGSNFTWCEVIGNIHDKLEPLK